MSAPGHVIEFVDRGYGHIHRYTPKCSCGWVGVHRPTKQAAAKEWRQHVRSIRKYRRIRYAPKPTTPKDKLPEELR